jgi:hypothetical protein
MNLNEAAQWQDPTEEIRREMQARINAGAADRHDLEVQTGGPVWDTDELRRDFEVIGFMAPLVVVRSRATGEKGSLFFQHSPRFYFNYEKDNC